MVIAWVGFASVGIFMARYMKVAFGDKELLGTKIWFTVRMMYFFRFINLFTASNGNALFNRFNFSGHNKDFVCRLES